MSSKPIYYCVYRITNIIVNKHYYGYKSSTKHPSEVICKLYFSSLSGIDGVNFRKDQQDYPENYKYKIIRIFTNRADALSLEIKLHRKYDVKNNPNFYNKANQTSSGFDTTGTKVSAEILAKVSAGKTGKMWYTNTATLETRKFYPGKEPEGYIRARVVTNEQRIRMQTGASNFMWIRNKITNQSKMVHKLTVVDDPWEIGRSIEYSQETLRSISNSTKQQIQRQIQSGQQKAIIAKAGETRKQSYNDEITHAIKLLGFETELDLYHALCYEVYCDKLCLSELKRKYEYIKPHKNYPTIGTFLNLYQIFPEKGKPGTKSKIKNQT